MRGEVEEQWPKKSPTTGLGFRERKPSGWWPILWAASGLKRETTTSRRTVNSVSISERKKKSNLKDLGNTLLSQGLSLYIL